MVLEGAEGSHTFARKKTTEKGHFCAEKNIEIKRAIGINGYKTSEIKKDNLEIKNFFSKLGIFLIG